MRKKILKNINSNLDKFLPSNPTIVFGFSGGADSVVLLHLLLKSYKKEQIIVCHFNHNLRGKLSDRDYIFVKDFCNQNGLKLFYKKENIKILAKKKKIGLEEMGRIRRRIFFEDVYEKVKADKIVLAHHEDDQVETFIMRLARGTGLKGIECMKIDDGIYFRPMLDASKKDILEYLNLNSLNFVQDDSNFDTNFTRNFIRLELLPKLQELNPKFNNAVSNLISNVSDVNAFLSGQINYFRRNFLYEFGKLKVLKLNSRLLEARPLLKSVMYKILIDDLDVSEYVNSKNLDDIIKLIYSSKSSGQVHISKSLVVEKGYKNIFFYNPSKLYPEDFMCKFDKKKYKKNFFEFNFGKKNKIEGICSYLKVINPEDIIIRLNKPGDKILYSKKKKIKKLHDIFINEKIPKFIRPYIPVVECRGEIIKVIGVRAKSFFESESNEKDVISLRYYSKLLEVIL